MKPKVVSALILGMIATLAGCSSSQSSLVPVQTAQNSAVSSPQARLRIRIAQTEQTLRKGCGPALPGRMSCLLMAPHAEFFPMDAIARAVVAKRPDNKCTINQPGCYGPASLQSAYNLKKEAASGGKGVTIAIVDPYGYPTAKQDLDQYREDFALPALCANCFTILNQRGKPQPLPSPGPSDLEQALDLDMVSAICPNCEIILVETASDSTSDFYRGVAVAVKKAQVVSLSWGAPETKASLPVLDKHPGVVITAGSGDWGYGYGAIQPCTFTGVVCVGGTSLRPDKSTRGWKEVVWSNLTASDGATGSACSSYVKKPSWQTDKGCTMRSAADLAAVGDPNTGVMVAFNGTCCYTGIGGTSVATPIIAGAFAITGNAKSVSPATIWQHGGTSVYNAVTKGNNGVCAAAIEYICTAGTKTDGVYSGPTGWGTPNGVGGL